MRFFAGGREVSDAAAGNQSPFPMVNIIRRFQQPLLIAITAFTIISFIWLFNRNSMNDRYNSGNVGTMYGRGISLNQYQRGGRLFQLAEGLQLQEFVFGLIGREMYLGYKFRQVPGDQVASEFAINDLVLRHEADRLSLEPSIDDVAEAEQKLPIFQTPQGVFDPVKYNMFVTTSLGPLGLSVDGFDELIRDQLRLRMIKSTSIGGAAQPAASEVRSCSYYEERYQKTDVSVVRLKLDDFKAAVNLTDDDLKKAFEERKATLNTPEKRKVRFAAFQLDQKKPPTGPERKDALEKLAEQAGNLSAKMTEKDAKFDELAPKFGATVQETPEFAENEPPTGLDEKAAEAAFRLTKAEPNSDPIVSEKQDGYFILQLEEIVPSRPQTFDEAKAQLTEQLKQERAQEAMTLKASEIRQKIETEVKAGKSFADAAQAAGAKAEPFPTFSMAERKNEGADANEVMSTASELRVGETSQFVPTSTGGLVLRVEKRLPIDEADFEKQKAGVAKQLAQGKSEALFSEWMKQRRKEANVHLGGA